MEQIITRHGSPSDFQDFMIKSKCIHNGCDLILSRQSIWPKSNQSPKIQSRSNNQTSNRIVKPRMSNKILETFFTLICSILDAISSTSNYSCQLVSESVSNLQFKILKIAIAPTELSQIFVRYFFRHLVNPWK